MDNEQLKQGLHFLAIWIVNNAVYKTEHDYGDYWLCENCGVRTPLEHGEKEQAYHAVDCIYIVAKNWLAELEKGK